MNVRIASGPARPSARPLAFALTTTFMVIAAGATAFAQAPRGRRPSKKPHQGATSSQGSARPGWRTGPAAAGPPRRPSSLSSSIRPWTKFCLKGQEANAQQVCFTGKDGRIESGMPVKDTAMADWKPPTQDRIEGYFKELNNWGRWGHDDQRGNRESDHPPRSARKPRRWCEPAGRSRSRETIGPQPAIMYNVTFPVEPRARRRGARSVRPRVSRLLDHAQSTRCATWRWDGELYNGRGFKDSLTAAGATWCAIDAYFDGLTTRGVLLDVAAGRKEGLRHGRSAGHSEGARCGRRAGGRSTSSRATWWSCATATSPSGRPIPTGFPRVSPHPGMHLSCLEVFREKDIAAISWGHDG